MRYPAIMLAAATAMLAIAACTDNQKQDIVPTAAAPDTGPPMINSGSIGSDSSSNAASGSTIRSQEGSALGRPNSTGY